MEVKVETAPAHPEIEVSVFGPGYGESLVLHLGEGNWFIIDSCIDRTGEVVPLAYLRHLDIDLSRAVKQVIATHWHDDHIRGLGRIVKECRSAEVICSAALRTPEFLTLVAAYGQRSMMTSSGVQEFYEVIQVLKERAKLSTERQSSSPRFAIAGRCLWQGAIRSSGSIFPCTVYALSPSDPAILLAQRSIATLLPQERTPKVQVPVLSPNHVAVVLWVNVGNIFILLGSDLEETGDPGTGWSVILGTQTYPQGEASLFKIPHHGSHTADHPQVWDTMLDTEPIAILTPFVHGNVSLPTQQDVDRICTRTDRAYTTATFKTRRRRGRPQVVEKEIRDAVRFIREVNYATGQVRLRINLADTSASWSVELFGEARPLRHIYAA